jgi:hypothetical protein
MPITNRLIRKIAEKDRIAFKKHSAMRMRERGIYADEVKNIMLHGKLLKNIQRTGPSQAVWSLGLLKNKNLSI